MSGAATPMTDISHDGRAAWTFPSVIDAIALRVPDRIAVVEADGSRLTWASFSDGADRIAGHLLEAGLRRPDAVAAFMRNSGAFLQTYLAAFRTGLVPVNINYRYGAEETHHLITDSGARAVVYHARFRDVIATVRSMGTQVQTWIEVPDDSGGTPPDWAVSMARLLADAPVGREQLAGCVADGDDHLLLYTGGTTGLPKGVIWRQDDLFQILLGRGNPLRDLPVPTSVDQLVDAATRRPGPVDLAACPYMHATGLFNQLMTLAAGGTSVVAPGDSFDAHVLLTTADRHRATLLVIVGDAMARPLADALDTAPDHWDLSALSAIVSSGATFSRAVKERLLDRLPEITILDAFGSSEASGMGVNISRHGDVRDTAHFALGERVRVITETGEFLEHGTAGEGLVALSGTLPVGYHNDPDKTARTFRVIDGVRYAIPGDHARVEPDGTLHLLGRGASCINSGGEKIYPEEVEEVVRRHAAVADAACIGVPDERFGETVAAVVALRPGADLDLDALRAHVKAHLAGYKAPRRLVLVDEVLRSPSGKLDHRWLRAAAAAG